MFRWFATTAALLFCATATVNGQARARATDPVFVRAQALVSDGNGAAGRALIDSVIAATPPGAPLYPQALFWRASLAASAADAESDYRHIVVDYPLAPQAEDALLRLAQLELARGDRDGALIHLQRIQRDYPRSKSLARASYWTARVLFEKNDVKAACAANATAQSQADSGEIELRNQIQYQGQRCPLITSATNAANLPGASTNQPSSEEASPKAASNGMAAGAVTVPAASAVSASPAPAREKEKPNAADTGSSATHGVPSPAAVPQTPRLKAPTEAKDANPSVVDPEKAPKTTAEKSVAKTAATAAGSVAYSVQVAAYNHNADAEKLVATLTKRGYAARVDGSVAPFRVRIGRYASENGAEEALKKIKAKHMDGFVVRAPER
jgi:cell division septation protein DedD